MNEMKNNEKQMQLVHIENLNIQFGDCHSTNYMGDVEEVSEEFENVPCDCDICKNFCDCEDLHEGVPAVDMTAMAEWIQKKTGVDLNAVGKVLCAEEEYLEGKGLAFSIEYENNDVDGKPANEDGAECEADRSKGDSVKTVDDNEANAAKDEDNSKRCVTFADIMDDLVPALLGMSLLGSLLGGTTTHKSEKMEGAHGKE